MSLLFVYFCSLAPKRLKCPIDFLSRGNWKYRWWSFKWWRQKPPASNPFFSFSKCYRIALQKARTWNYRREFTVCKLQIVSNIHRRFQSESWTSSLMMTEHCISDNMATIKTCQTATSSTIIIAVKRRNRLPLIYTV